MKRLQDIGRVWRYIDQEWQDVHERPPTPTEIMCIVTVVSAITKMLKDDQDPKTARR